MSTKSSTWAQKRRYEGQFVVWSGITYVSEAYAKLMISRSTMRAVAEEVKETTPLLPDGWGQGIINFENVGL